MNRLDFEQGSDEWFAQRLGKVTASRVADVVAKTKSGWSGSRANYQAALIIERITGVQQNTYQSQAMLDGIAREPDARAAYEWLKDVEVELVGFVEHPAVPMSGASPDGLVGADGLVEIKAPQSATHLATLLGEPIPNKYLLQMQWQLACTGRAWCDFVSYSPAYPEAMRLHTQRVQRDDELISALEKDVATFLVEAEKKLDELRKMYGADEPPLIPHREMMKQLQEPAAE